MVTCWGGGVKEQEKHHRGTPMVIKMENPNWCISEIEAPSSDEDKFIPRKSKKSIGKNAKQLTWVLLLKAHRAAGCLSSLAAAVRRRVKSGTTDSTDTSVSENPTVRCRLHTFIRAFLFLSLLLLSFEIAAYFKGWHFRDPTHYFGHILSAGKSGVFEFDFKDLFGWGYDKWVLIRVGYLAQPLQWLANACIVLFLVQSLDRLVLCLGCFWIHLRKIKPVPKTDQVPDVESGDGGGYFPMVLIQIPMCNEKEVYQQSIGAVCSLEWPKSKLLIQVLDDSDDPTTQILIKEEVHQWQAEGANILYRHRVIRDGYKAGNLKSAMHCDYVKDYEFVAIFDANFQPNPDFLKRTVVHFKDNEEVGLVQARWSFVNKDENLLTRLQNINLAFHFEVEQQVNGIFLNFFGFNGAAGVWRIKALEESGGWLERTTVEDMDIAVRAHLNGWKFVFLNDVECQCELPESYEAYRKQQHSWHLGPMQLFRLCLPDIIKSKICFWKKANLIFLFFLLRKLVLPFYSFTLFCIILPMTVFIPEAELPAWVVCYIPATMFFLNILSAPKFFSFIVPYPLFENTMSVTKFNAVISGLFQLGRRGQATNSHSLAERVKREKIRERMMLLQKLVPGCNKSTGKVVMLDEIINYVQSLQQQIEFLSMKLGTVNRELNFDIERLQSKDNSEGDPQKDHLSDASGQKEQDDKKQKNDQNAGTNSSGKQTEKQVKDNLQGEEANKQNYIHVRAGRSQATNSHSLAEMVRREKISERMRLLQELVPGCNKITGKAVMLDEIINYVQSLQRQSEFLSMKLATANPKLNFDVGRLLSKDLST